MARRADDPELDPVVMPIDDEEPRLSLDEWLALIEADEPVELPVRAADVLAAARAVGET